MYNAYLSGYAPYTNTLPNIMKVKKIFLTFGISLFYTIGINAQETLEKLRIGLSTNIENNISSESFAFDKHIGYSANYNKTNYRFGLNFEYDLKDDISINSSINYSNKDFTGTYYCAVCEFIVPPSPQEIDFRFIEIPLTLKYYFLPNKIRLFGEFGLNNLLSLNNEVTDNSYILGLKLGGGIEYNFTNKLALQINIDYNNSLSKLYKESDFKLKSIDFGIGIMKRI